MAEARTQGWILGGALPDGLLVLFPGLVGIALSLGLPETPWALTLYTLLALVLVDAGHVYTTMWRTVFRRSERSAHPIYWVAPLACFIGVFAWLWLRVPYLWMAVVYATVYHHIRQFYGVLRWYEKLNRRFDIISHRFLYALTLTPFALFHLRSDVHVALYTEHDLLIVPMPALLTAGLWAYAALVAAWLAYEATLWRRGLREPNRLAAIASPAALYGVCFLTGTTVLDVIFPLLLAHGIPYFAMMGLSLRRIAPATWRSLAAVTAVILGTAAAFGALEGFYEDRLLTTIDAAYADAPITLAQAALTAAYLVPVLCHYIWDAHIWKGTHPDARAIYADSPAPIAVPPPSG